MPTRQLIWEGGIKRSSIVVHFRFDGCETVVILKERQMRNVRFARASAAIALLGPIAAERAGKSLKSHYLRARGIGRRWC